MISRESYIESGAVSCLPYEVGVYTQGKVGSKAVVAALRGMYAADGPDSHMYVWDFCRTSLEGVRQHERIRGTRRRLQVDEPEIVEFMLAHPDRDMRLTSVAREPVVISVSSFFYNFAFRNPGADIRRLRDAEIIRRLVAGESFSHPAHHLDWFDTEVKPQMGIDIYHHRRFPIHRGFGVYSGRRGQRRTDLLILRLEDMAHVGAAALASFYGKPQPVIGRVNTADEKPYRDRYKEFLQHASLPAGWVAWQLNSRYAKFFYSRDERMALASRWSGSVNEID